MRAFVQTAVREFGERDLPMPRAAAGEVVVRVRAALTCGTDVKLLKRGHARIRPPMTMGHELSGEIVERGSGVTQFAVGDRVVPGVSGPCGRCDSCRSGRANLCEFAGERMWGAFAEFARVPAGVVAVNLHRVPAGLSDEMAAFVDPLASVLHGWNRLGEFSGTLLVYGAGAVGLLWAAVARLRGVECVVASRRPERLAFAEMYGARPLDLRGQTPERLASGAEAAAAVDATGDPRVWERLPDLVRAGGSVVLFGGCAPAATVTYDAARLHYSEITLLGSFHYTPEEARGAMGLLASGTIDPGPLVTARGSLSDLPRFLDAQARGEGIRYAIRND